MEIVTFNNAGIPLRDSTKERSKRMLSKEITKIQCLFRTSKCFSDLFKEKPVMDINVGILHKDLIYFSATVVDNFKNFVTVKTNNALCFQFNEYKENEGKENE